MGVDVKVELNQKSLADLGFAIHRLEKETGRSTNDAVTFAAIYVAQSGRAASKKSQKNRRILKNPIYDEAKKSSKSARRKVARIEKARQNGNKTKKGNPIKPIQLTHAETFSLRNFLKEPPFFIVRMRQNKEDFLLPTWDRKDDRVLIKNSGLAKTTWNVMVGKLGAMKGSTNAQTVSDSSFRVAKYFEVLGDDGKSVAVRLVNKLSYLEKAYPGITNTAIQSGSNRLHKMLDDRIAKAAQKANTGN
tara:strand:- start:1139 stop:1879 length:741 start_codon:yes stop_codon:yes gene_type:complete